MSKKEKELFREKLALLDMGLEDRMKNPVGLLSGGQRQALTLLMATLITPKILLLDEHTAALDPATAEKVLNLTKKIVAENHLTCLMITHNMQSALELGNRTIMMNSHPRFRGGGAGRPDGGRPAGEVQRGRGRPVRQRPDVVVIEKRNKKQPPGREAAFVLSNLILPEAEE